MKQLRESFFVSILLPVFCLSIFIFYSSFSYIRKQSFEENLNMVKQNAAELSNRMKECDNSLRYLTANYSLQVFLSMNEANYFQINQSAKEISSLLYNVMLTNRYYRKLTVYTDKNVWLSSGVWKSIGEVKQEAWYQAVMNTSENYSWYEDGKVFMTRKVMITYPNSCIGVIKVQLKDEVLENSFSTFHNIPIKISIKDGEKTFYEYGNKTWEKNKKFEYHTNIEKTDWIICYQINQQYYWHYAFIGIWIPVLVVALVLLMVWICMYIFSKRLTKDLFILVEEVNEVQKGDLDIKFQEVSTTEIQMLSKSIERLIYRIRQLIRRVYAKEIEKQNLELNLLQSKMSPHFLYNNLSAINWLALDSEQYKIYEITTEMATFYRTALNKGKNIDKLSIEVTNIKSYLKLQLIAHEDSFDVEYDIADELLQYDVPIFIMQPLVENAIEHGIDQLRRQRGKIKVAVHCEEEWMYIQIFDNGTELYQKIGCCELEEIAFGYGVSNVHKRIQLLYGKQSGVRIEASEKGTLSEVKFCFKQLQIPI